MRERKEERGGWALTAAELRRDALIAPSGCGQYGREEGDTVRGEGGFSSLPDVVIGRDVAKALWYRVYTQGDRCLCPKKYSLGLSDKTQPLPHGGKPLLKKAGCGCWKLL